MLAAAMDLFWVLPASQLDGLANGTDCLVNQLSSDVVAMSIVSLPDPDSKGAEDVGFAGGGQALKER